MNLFMNTNLLFLIRLLGFRRQRKTYLYISKSPTLCARYIYAFTYVFTYFEFHVVTSLLRHS